MLSVRCLISDLPMVFQSPLMLLGVGAAVLPLVLHLLSRSRYKTVDWGGMLFLAMPGDARQRRSARMHRWVLMLIRMAIIATLAVALARPSLPGRWGGVAGPGGDRRAGAGMREWSGGKGVGGSGGAGGEPAGGGDHPGLLREHGVRRERRPADGPRPRRRAAGARSAPPGRLGRAGLRGGGASAWRGRRRRDGGLPADDRS